MLFNSAEFLFAFLPITLAGFYLLSQWTSRQRWAMAWLVLASLFFYSWWEPKNLVLLVFSLGFNYTLSQYLIRRTREQRPDKFGLIVGIVVNVGLLVWFKYANFLAGNIGAMFGESWSLGRIVLPLAISFFTFQQISYLVDGYRGRVDLCHPLDYSMVVTFFPHLIAGPIVRYNDVLPQFHDPAIFKFDRNRFGAGLSLFAMGLFKKMVFADSIAPYANMAFDSAAQGVTLTFTESWVGSLAYTCQLYFDFSGYSDMAIGLAWMFGIRFTHNFNSPYKATSIVEFWRRWHITLSAFLRDYVYIALGGNRAGYLRSRFNLLATMLVGGLWHGAGWNFLIWGGLHGGYLVINHVWRDRFGGHGEGKSSWYGGALSWLITFLAVVVAWVLFRAIDLRTATSMLESMIGLHGWQLPDFLVGPLGFLKNFGFSFDGFTANVGIPQKYSIVGIVLLMFIAVSMPNTQQWLGRFHPALGPAADIAQTHVGGWFKLKGWQPTWAWSAIVGLLAGVCVLCLTRVSQFIYFQF